MSEDSTKYWLSKDMDELQRTVGGSCDRKKMHKAVLKYVRVIGWRPPACIKCEGTRTGEIEVLGNGDVLKLCIRCQGTGSEAT